MKLVKCVAFASFIIFQAMTSIAECSIENLALVDVSCSPPHGDGPDGRVWLKLTCGSAKAPLPYDWQLARLSNDLADIFAWNDDPTYAYIQGQPGTYQAAAYIQLAGEVNLNFSLPIAECKPKRQK